MLLHSSTISGSVMLARWQVLMAMEWCGIIERRNCVSPTNVWVRMARNAARKRMARDERAARRAATDAATPAASPRPPTGKRCAPRQVAAWLMRPPDDVKPAQRAYLDALVALCPGIGTVQALAQDVARLLRERDEAGLATWLNTAEACAEAEMRAFALGIRRDQAAVQAALAHEWSSGQVEGQVNVRFVPSKPSADTADGGWGARKGGVLT